MIFKPDCFAFISPREDGCDALNILDCEGCKTYKSKAQVEEEQKKVLQKLREKPYTERLMLSELYKIEGIL